MNRSELQQLQAHVRERISELEVLVARRDDSIANAQHAARQVTLADAELELRIADMEKRELVRLQANLQWLASAEGGSCVQCGQVIPVARLRAVPVTRLCVACADAGS